MSAKAGMAARLKVFTWSDGFHAFTVAASSRPKALEAWGMTSDIFKTGLASEAPDGPDKTAALGSPGAVITRGLTVDVGKAETRKPKPRNEKAIAKVNALETSLADLDAEQARQIEVLDARQTDLDRDRRRQSEDYDTARRAVLAKLKTARAAAG